MKITQWTIIKHHGMPYNITEITAKFDGIERKVTINWIKETLTVSARYPQNWDYPLDSHTFPIPKSDIVTYLENQMRKP